MTKEKNSSVDQSFLVNAMASFVQIGAVLIIVYWCFTIVSPFVPVFLWGLIMGVALYPVHIALSARLGGREKWSATILVLVGLTILVVPALILAESTVGALQSVAAHIEDGTAEFPPPADNVANWPIIGDRVYEGWSAASANIESTINKFRPQLRAAGRQTLSLAGHMVGSAFLFAFSIILAGVFLTTASRGYAATRNIASNLVGAERGPAFTDLAILTIRSVAKGVLGVALIQAILAAVGLLIAGVPGAGVWAGLVLILAIVQLPPLIVLGPIAIWYFSVAEPVPALIFLVYAAIVSVSDTFLKPLLLGRGVEVPMLVILVGAIGGAIAKGIIGLFVGAVILALGYELLKLWMTSGDPEFDIEEPPAETR